MHLGHQRILQRVLDEARRRGLQSLVFTFEPTPREYFSSGEPAGAADAVPREVRGVVRASASSGCIARASSAHLESLEPEAFIEQLLVRTLRREAPRRRRRLSLRARRGPGTLADLQAAGRRAGFTVEQVGSVTADGVRVSSTAVREALAAGDMDRARQLLGRYYSMTGRVIRGQRLGPAAGHADRQRQSVPPR